MGNRHRPSAGAALVVLVCGFCAWRSALPALGEVSGAEAHFKRWQARPELRDELDRALALNPRYAAAWIGRGLEAEAAGDRRTAEQSLLRAAEVDHTYLPSWTLANFYLRAGETPQFWIWSRRAAAMAYDPTALFQLCWRVSSDAAEILDRAIPSSPPLRRSYLDFLVGGGRIDAAETVAAELRRAPQIADLDLLLRYCDLALARNRVGPAAETWNALARARLIPYREGALLSNKDLASAPLDRGFDWRLKPTPGAEVSIDPAAGEMLVSLSGKQPENWDLAVQYLAVEPGRAYRFGFRARTRELAAESGLDWSFLDARTSAAVAMVAAPPAESGWSERALEFSTPPGCDLARLTLRFRRPAGAVRASGFIAFSRFTLERAQ